MQPNNVILPAYNSVIGWRGGKTKLRPTIINCMPPHIAFIEVFCGSATVFFGKPPSKIEIINDISQDLVNLMKVISGTYFDEGIRKEFINYVRNMPASRSAYQEWKTWGQDQIDQLTPAQRAFRFYYCVKKGFSSVPNGGYEASPLTKSRYNMKTDFDQFAERFRSTNAQIEELHFQELIIKYNRVRADSFFFCDPPYFVANDTNYYAHVFDSNDHVNLKKSCDEIHENNNKFLITYDDVPEVIDLYGKYFIYRTDPIVYSSSDERGGRSLIKQELFVTNYDIATIINARNRDASKKNADMFSDVVDESRIDIPGHIGLERIK